MLISSHKEEFKEIHARFKKLYPVNTSESFLAVTRANARIREYAISELMDRYVLEYRSIMRRLNPSIKENSRKTWIIKTYSDHVSVFLRNKEVLTTDSLEIALDWIKENS
jgi:hypothetical protein